MEGIYLVWTREFRNQNSKVYKVGRTSQGIQARLAGYPKGSQLLLWQTCPNTKDLEKTILSKLDKKFQKKTEYGREYFAGEEAEMISEINDSIRASREALERTELAIDSPEMSCSPLPDVGVEDASERFRQHLISQLREKHGGDGKIDAFISTISPKVENPENVEDAGEKIGREIMWGWIIFMTFIIISAKIMEILFGSRD